MKVIGLNGYGGSGKDALGQYLIEKHGFERKAFADKLRECLYLLNPIVTGQDGVGFIRIQDMIPPVFDSESWTEVKKVDEVRDLLQRLGTDAGRNVLGYNVWVDATFHDMVLAGVNHNFVITDVRFPNEAHRIAEWGHMVRIDRPGIGPVNDHISETSLDDYDFDLRINNDGTLADLYKKFDEWFVK